MKKNIQMFVGQRKLAANSPDTLIAVSFLLVCLSCSFGGRTGGREIVLFPDYETGFGGFTHPVYNPYVFFTDGTVVKEPKLALDDLNLGAMDKEQANDWGKWKRSGNKVEITWHGTNRKGELRIKELKWPERHTAYSAGRRERLNGTFSTMSGGGNIAFGGSVGVANMSRFTFTSDGRFTTESVVSSSDDNFTVWNKENTAGTYTLEGHTITLRFNSGDTKRLFFCFYGKDKRVFRIAGRTYTPVSTKN